MFEGGVSFLTGSWERLLQGRPKGGRFYVTPAGVYLADGDGEVITAEEG